MGANRQTRRGLLVLLALLLSATASPARGQNSDPSDLAALQTQLTRLREERPAAVPAGSLTAIEHVLLTSAELERRFPQRAPSGTAAPSATSPGPPRASTPSPRSAARSSTGATAPP